MFRDNPFCLRFPDLSRVVIDYMEKRIVLNHRDGQLNDAIHEIRQNGTTPAVLRVEAGGVWDRHVVLEFKCLQPLLIPIKSSCSKTSSANTPAKIIDLSGSRRELGSISEQCSIVIKVVDVRL